MNTKEVEMLRRELEAGGMDSADAETATEIIARIRVTERVETALRDGYGITGDIRIEPIAPGDTGRYEVWVDKNWFGVWDVERETFVE